MFKRPLYVLIYDIVLVSAIFMFWIWLKPASLRVYLPNYLVAFLIFIGIWLFSSIFMHKYKVLKTKNLNRINWNIVSANFIALSICTVLIYAIRIDYFSRQIVFGTVGVSTFFELIGAILFYNVANATEILEPVSKDTKVEDYTDQYIKKPPEKRYDPHGPVEEKIKQKLIETCGKDVYDVVTENINPYYPKSLILSTITQFNVDKQPDEYFENIINIKNVNDIRFINKFFKAVHAKLPFGGVFIGSAEIKKMRKNRILSKYPVLLNYVVYTLDFIFNRLMPKFQFTKGLYYFITKGMNRALTKAEILGRLYYCGFELVRDVTTSDKYFFIVHKISPPVRVPHSKYGLFIKLRRIGKNKKKIIVYKLRTMHPYSEYIQDLVYSRHGTEDGDKATNDYRITNMGKIFRRLWLDEFPMVLNLLKGEIKIVGVRPLSEAKFKMYPKYMQEKRTRCKPGLIPPFYVDLPDSFEELVASEEKYLDQYFKHPFRTDVKYFFKAVNKILIKKARSG